MGRLDLENEHLELQLEHLVLDLSVLNRGGGIAAQAIENFVEATGPDFGVFSNLTCVLEDL